MPHPVRRVTPNHTCVLCEGNWDVTPGTVQGVPMDVCKWCWTKFGPPRHLDGPYDPTDPTGPPLPAHEVLTGFLDGDDERDAARAEQVARNQRRERR